MKALYSSFAPQVEDDLQLYGENMTAIHSIVYTGLKSCFYLFAVRRVSTGEWIAWDDVVKLANELDLPHVPVLWRGTISRLGELEHLLQSAAKMPSAVSASPGEGFVVRRSSSFTDAAFASSMAKYVRADHIQTTADFRRNWVKASFCEAQERAVQPTVELPRAASCVAEVRSALPRERRGKAHQTGHGEPAGKQGRRRRKGASSGANRGRDGDSRTDEQQPDRARGSLDCALPPLPSEEVDEHQLKLLFRGPTKRSNWVIPGRVMAGDRSALDQHAALESLVHAGIDTIVW